VGTAKILIPEVALKAVDPEWFPPPSEVGICRHLYLADEEYLIRNENGRVVEAVNLGTEGNAVDEYDFGTETVTVDGHQYLDGSSIYYASLASQLGFGGTELTMFAAVHSRTDYYPGDLGPFAAISLNPNYITSYRPNVVFKCASSYARADVNYQYLYQSFSIAQEEILVLGVKAQIISYNYNSIDLPAYLNGLLPRATRSGSNNDWNPFFPEQYVILLPSDYFAQAEGLLRGLSVHEGHLTDQEMTEVGYWWLNQMAREVEVSPPRRFVQCAQQLNADDVRLPWDPDPILASTVQIKDQVTKNFYGSSFGGASLLLGVDGQRYVHTAYGNSPLYHGSTKPDDSVTAFTIGGVIMHNERPSGIYSNGAMHVRVTTDGRIKVLTEHNTAQSSPLSPRMPHSFLVVVNYNGANADEHIPVLIVDGVSDRALEHSGFGPRSIAYERYEFSERVESAPAVGNMIFRDVFSIEDILDNDQTQLLVDYIEGLRTTGGVIAGWPIENLHEAWGLIISTLPYTASPFEWGLRWQSGNYASPDYAYMKNTAPSRVITFTRAPDALMPYVWNDEQYWGRSYRAVADAPPAEDESVNLIMNGGPVTFYIAGFFRDPRGSLLTSPIFGSVPEGPAAVGRKGTFFGHYQGQLHFTILQSVSPYVVLDVAFDLVGHHGVVIQLNYGGSPEYLVESISPDGVRNVISSGSFALPPPGGTFGGVFEMFSHDEGYTDKFQNEFSRAGIWADLKDIDIIAAVHTEEFSSVESVADIAARDILMLPRTNNFVPWAQRNLIPAQDFIEPPDISSGLYGWYAGQLVSGNRPGVGGNFFSGTSTNGYGYLDWQRVPPSWRHASYGRISNTALSPRMTFSGVFATQSPSYYTPLIRWSDYDSGPPVQSYTFRAELNAGGRIGSISFYMSSEGPATPTFVQTRVYYDFGSVDTSEYHAYLFEFDFHETGADIIKAVYVDGVSIPVAEIPYDEGVFLPTVSRSPWDSQVYTGPNSLRMRGLAMHQTIFESEIRDALMAHWDAERFVQDYTYPEDYGFCIYSFIADEEFVILGGHIPQREITRWENNVITAYTNRRDYRELTYGFGRLEGEAPYQMMVMNWTIPYPEFAVKYQHWKAAGQRTLSWVCERRGYYASIWYHYQPGGPSTKSYRVVVDDAGFSVRIEDGITGYVQVRVNAGDGDYVANSYLLEIDLSLTGAAMVKSMFVNGVEQTMIVEHADPIGPLEITYHSESMGSDNLSMRGFAIHDTLFDTRERDLLLGYWEAQRLGVLGT
jgi:hypothetical protein